MKGLQLFLALYIDIDVCMCVSGFALGLNTLQGGARVATEGFDEIA